MKPTQWALAGAFIGILFAVGPLAERASLRPQLGDGAGRQRVLGGHSHSIVPGGLDVMSSTTRLTSRISLIIRDAIRSSRS